MRREEALYWRRSSLVRRYPRPFALVLAAVGGLGTAQVLTVLEHGGSYAMLRTMLSPAMLAAGLWPLVLGFPTDEDLRALAWWMAGWIATTAAGFVSGVWLLARLMELTSPR